MSTVISTPNEAVHDVMLETNGWEDAYIDPDGVTNPDCADAVYIAIESKDSTSTIELSVETGDNSTGMFRMMVVYIIIILLMPRDHTSVSQVEEHRHFWEGTALIISCSDNINN